MLRRYRIMVAVLPSVGGFDLDKIDCLNWRGGFWHGILVPFADIAGVKALSFI